MDSSVYADKFYKIRELYKDPTFTMSNSYCK